MITKKDIIRPISALFFLQPFVMLWLIITVDNPTEQYFMTAWGLQIYITIILIPYYAWFENIWSK